MSKIFIPKNNTSWGVIVNEHSDNEYQHAIWFRNETENEDVKGDFVNKYLTERVDYTDINNGYWVNKKFIRNTPTTGEVEIRVEDYKYDGTEDEKIDRLWNLDNLLVHENGVFSFWIVGDIERVNASVFVLKVYIDEIMSAHHKTLFNDTPALINSKFIDSDSNSFEDYRFRDIYEKFNNESSLEDRPQSKDDTFAIFIFKKISVENAETYINQTPSGFSVYLLFTSFENYEENVVNGGAPVFTRDKFKELSNDPDVIDIQLVPMFDLFDFYRNNVNYDGTRFTINADIGYTIMDDNFRISETLISEWSGTDRTGELWVEPTKESDLTIENTIFNFVNSTRAVIAVRYGEDYHGLNGAAVSIKYTFHAPNGNLILTNGRDTRTIKVPSIPFSTSAWEQYVAENRFQEQNIYKDGNSANKTWMQQNSTARLSGAVSWVGNKVGRLRPKKQAERMNVVMSSDTYKFADDVWALFIGRFAPSFYIYQNVSRNKFDVDDNFWDWYTKGIQYNNFGNLKDTIEEREYFQPIIVEDAYFSINQNLSPQIKQNIHNYLKNGITFNMYDINKTFNGIKFYGKYNAVIS